MSWHQTSLTESVSLLEDLAGLVENESDLTSFWVSQEVSALIWSLLQALIAVFVFVYRALVLLEQLLFVLCERVLDRERLLLAAQPLDSGSSPSRGRGSVAQRIELRVLYFGGG